MYTIQVNRLSNRSKELLASDVFNCKSCVVGPAGRLTPCCHIACMTYRLVIKGVCRDHFNWNFY